MTGFNHTLAGSIIAVIVPAPAVPFLAFLSHFLLDATPHFGNSKRIEPYNKNFIYLLICDAVLCFSTLFFSWWLFPDKIIVITLGAFFSTLPDFMWLLDGKVAKLNPFFKFAKVIQWGERPWGWVLEIVYGCVFLAILLTLSGKI